MIRTLWVHTKDYVKPNFLIMCQLKLFLKHELTTDPQYFELQNQFSVGVHCTVKTTMFLIKCHITVNIMWDVVE